MTTNSGIAPLFDLSGTTTVVTGAGRGIGKAVAELFARAGARVVVADIDAGTARSVADAIVAGGGQSIAVSSDISDEASVKAMYATALEKFGSIDNLVHSAAIFPKYALLDITVEQWDKIQAVNLRGTMLVMREAIRHMRAAGRGGSIVNISSVSGEREVVFHNAAYGASKAGTTNLTRVAALEFGVDKIRVNAVLPGGTATEGAMAASKEMIQRGLEMKGPMTQPGRVPLGMMGSPEDIAAACLFFASPASKQITGQCLAVDGGFMVS
jgi:NAD(P)-dependent dehydrogenase (short-subunit alcohol dehydrogenase family)